MTVGGRAVPADDRALVIDINNPNRSLYPIAVPRGVASDSALTKEVQDITSFDLSVAGWFKILDPRSFLANLEGEGLGIDVQKWKDVGAFGVIKYRVTRSGSSVDAQFRLYEIEKGDQPVLSRSYQGSDVRTLVHKWCNEVVLYYTGEAGFFGSKIAFVTKRSGGGKAVMAMDFDGNGVYSITRNSSLNILPSWSPNGGKVAFTSYMRNNPDLYVASAGGGRPTRISKYAGMNTGASWSPDGSRIALTLSKDGDPEIYIIDAANGQVVRRLTRNRAIDTSPAWSPSGREIAFVSDREGGPQIFVMNADGSNQRNLTGNQGDESKPAFSPDGRQIVFASARDRNSDIYLFNLRSGTPVNQTNSNVYESQPVFTPDGMRILFVSGIRGMRFRDIVIKNIHSGETHNLTPGLNYVNQFISCSADSRRLVFESITGPDSEIYIVDTDGQNLTNLTNHSKWDSSPTF